MIFLKKALSLLLAFIMVFSLVPLDKTAFAAEIVAEGYCGGEGDGTNLTWQIDSDGVLTISGTGAMADYTFSNGETAEEDPYVSPLPWSEYEASVTALNIEEGVTTIGTFAFCNMAAIGATLSLPDSIESIETGAFINCGFNGEIELPANLKHIGRNAFFGNLILSVDLPASVESIDAVPFNFCKNLESITVDDANPYYCSADGALFDKDKTTIIQYPAAKTGAYTLPLSVTTVGENAFSGSKLTEVVLPANIEKVDRFAFQGSSAKITFLGRVDTVEIFATSKTENVYFYGAPPVNVNAADSEYPSFNTDIIIYYLEGTKGWDDDGDGLWNGYTVKTFSDSEVEWDESQYVASGYCGANPNGGKNLAWMLDSDGLLTIKGTGAMADYSINWEGDLWITTAPWANCEVAVTSLNIEEGITTVGEDAFYNISTLAGTLSLPESVKSIGADAFGHCGFIEEVKLPSNLKYIGSGAFEYCESITGVVFDENLQTIGNEAFRDCYSITEVYLPASVTSIGNAPFGCCKSLESITVDEANPNYCSDDGALFNKDKTILLQYLYAKTGSYSVPSTVKTIGAFAFWWSQLSEIILPETVEIIEDRAFVRSSATVAFLGQVDTIGKYVISGSDVYFYGAPPTNVYAADSDPEDPSFNTDIIIYYLEGTKGWDDDGDGLWNGYAVKTFSDSEVNWDESQYVASGYCGANPNGGKNLAWMLDSNGLLTIKGTGAMADYLTAIEDTSEGAVWISTAPWINCGEKVTSLKIEDGVTTVGEHAFYKMTTLVGTLSLPESIESIGRVAFRFCGFDGEVKLPSNLKYIGQEAFEHCENIESIIFNENLQTIEDYAFHSCVSITDVYLPASITSIGIAPFAFCQSLENITVDAANEYYSSASGALFNNDKTALIQYPAAKTGNYTVPSTVKTVGENAFCCSELTQIVLPESVVVVENRAFQSSFAEIIFYGQVDTIAQYAIDRAENVYFYGKPPINVNAADSARPSFNTNITIYYVDGIEGWDDDGDGLWNGYNVIADAKKELTFDEWWTIKEKIPSEKIHYDFSEALTADGGLTYNYDENDGLITITVNDISPENWAQVFETEFFSNDRIIQYISVDNLDGVAGVYCTGANVEEFIRNFENNYNDNVNYNYSATSQDWIIEIATAKTLEDGSAVVFPQGTTYFDDFICFAYEMTDGTYEHRFLRYRVVLNCENSIEIPAGSVEVDNVVESSRISPDTSISLISAYRNEKLDYSLHAGILEYHYTGSKTTAETIEEELTSINSNIKTVITAPDGYTVSSVSGSADYTIGDSTVTLKTYIGSGIGIEGSEYLISWENASGETFTEKLWIHLTTDITWMKKNGFKPIPKSRMTYSESNLKLLKENGINVDIDDVTGYIKVTFDEKVDLDNILRNKGDLYNFLRIQITPPEGAAYYKYPGLAGNSMINGWNVTFYRDMTMEEPNVQSKNVSEGVYLNYPRGLSSTYLTDGILWFADSFHYAQTIWWYDENNNLIDVEYVYGYFEPFSSKSNKATSMEQQGFSPVPKERITIPSADAINNNGADIAIDNNGGYIKNSFGENTNISEIIKNLTSLYSGNQQCLDIKIEKPENAVSGKFAISSVTGNNSDDFYYSLPNMSEADAQNINIDENGYMNYWCIYAWSELNGRVWHKEKEITLLWLWWYDAKGEVVKKEFLSYNTDEYNMPSPLEEVTWNAENYVASGYCGASYHGSKNLAWMLDSEGVLTIEGKGAMEDYGEIIYSDGTTKWTSPWADYADRIKKVVIGDGVTLIGSSAFTDARLTADIYFLGDAPSETFAVFNESATLYYLENKTGWDLEDDGKWHGYNIKTWVVPVPVTNMTLMAPDNIFVGRDEQFSVIIEPENATNKDVIWSVENGTGSATISESGLFTPVSEGTVTVTATAADESGIFVSKTINVIKSGNGKAFVGITSDVTCKKGLAKVSVELSEDSRATTIQFAVSYDADKLSVVSAEAGALMEGKNPDINVSIPGVIVFAWDTDSDSLDLKGSLLDITFVAKETAGGEHVSVEILPDSDEYNFVFASSQDKEYQSIDMTLQNGQVEVIDALLGDVNGDGRINVIDANLVRRSSAEIISLNEVETLTADVNGDGSVDVIDANCIRKYAVKFIKDFVELSK